MDEPRDPLDLWTADRAALVEHTRQQLPSLDETQRLVLASATHTHTRNREPKERTMSFVKRRPALAAALALIVLAVLTPVAYAVVNRIFVSVDPDQPAEQIEKDVTQQLEQAGISHPVVTAHKNDGRLEIGISTDDQRLASGDLAVKVRGDQAGDGTQSRRRIELDTRCQLTPAQNQALIDTLSGHDLVDLLTQAAPDESDADLAADVEGVLADHGFPDTEVTVNGESIHVVVEHPPAD